MDSKMPDMIMTVGQSETNSCLNLMRSTAKRVPALLCMRHDLPVVVCAMRHQEGSSGACSYKAILHQHLTKVVCFTSWLSVSFNIKF